MKFTSMRMTRKWYIKTLIQASINWREVITLDAMRISLVEILQVCYMLVSYPLYYFIMNTIRSLDCSLFVVSSLECIYNFFSRFINFVRERTRSGALQSVQVFTFFLAQYHLNEIFRIGLMPVPAFHFEHIKDFE